MLFGEYFVLEGAQALAIPTQLGQDLTITSQTFLVKGLNWKSFDHEGKLWFEVYFDENLDIKHTTDVEVARTLQTILFAAKELNPDLLQGDFYFDAETRLQFPRQWGLGSSSTLIANIAQWAQADAFSLFFNSFKGSGYDIACAISPQPILYQLKDKKAHWHSVDFNPVFAENIAFVYLGKKQNSREGIQHFNQKYRQLDKETKLISTITQKALSCDTIDSFMALMSEHEEIVAQALDLSKVKDLYFNDFDGEIKSLGAWGGDFVMAAARLPFVEIKNYFINKGFTTIVPYNEMRRH